eukprot:4825460-Pyramimonas_sp.AAC.1
MCAAMAPRMLLRKLAGARSPAGEEPPHPFLPAAPRGGRHRRDPPGPAGERSAEGSAPTREVQ